MARGIIIGDRVPPSPWGRGVVWPTLLGAIPGSREMKCAGSMLIFPRGKASRHRWSPILPPVPLQENIMYSSMVGRNNTTLTTYTTDHFEIQNSSFAISKTHPIYGIHPITFHPRLSPLSRCGWFSSFRVSVTVRMTDQLGFHNLPFLAHRKSVKRGFEFTLMVVGKCSSNL